MQMQLIWELLQEGDLAMFSLGGNIINAGIGVKFGDSKGSADKDAGADESVKEGLKPVFIEENFFYTKDNLVLEDFGKDLIVSKFITDEGEFLLEKKGKHRYGKWTVSKKPEEKILQTATRLPDLTKFDGIMFSVKSENIKKFKLILVERKLKTDRNWEIPIAGIKSEWQTIKVPFRYFQLPDDINAKLDIAKIARIKFLIDKESTGYLAIDDVMFYK